MMIAPVVYMRVPGCDYRDCFTFAPADVADSDMFGLVSDSLQDTVAGEGVRRVCVNRGELSLCGMSGHLSDMLGRGHEDASPYVMCGARPLLCFIGVSFRRDPGDYVPAIPADGEIVDMFVPLAEKVWSQTEGSHMLDSAIPTGYAPYQPIDDCGTMRFPKGVPAECMGFQEIEMMRTAMASEEPVSVCCNVPSGSAVFGRFDVPIVRNDEPETFGRTISRILKGIFGRPRVRH